MEKKITCHCNGATVTYLLDPQMKLKELREKLSHDGHLPPDSADTNFNFINGKVNSTDAKTILSDLSKYSDYTIVARTYESSISLETVLCGGNSIMMFNTLAKSNKSLIGFKTHWWSDRQIHVSCHSFGSSEFKPLMLSHVVAMGGASESSKTPVTILNNVCICTPDSTVSFVIYGKGGVGFRFSIHINTGDKPTTLVDGLFCVYSKEVGEKAVSLSRWGDDDRAIKIQSTNSLHIDGKNAAYYQQVTIKCLKVNSFKNAEGHKFRANAVPHKNSQNTVDVAPIDGKRIEPSTPTKGDPTGHTFGTIYDVDVDNSTVFGELTIWFFNFRSLDDARKVFEYVDPMEFRYDEPSNKLR